MDHFFILFLLGCLVGTVGTLIGAGGGFVLVPILILTHPDMRPEIITAISMAIVAANAISGSVAYARSGRIDYRAGILFALFTIPGSILGVYTVDYIPKYAFHLIFGVLLILLSVLLFISKDKKTVPRTSKVHADKTRLVEHHLTDRAGLHYIFQYNPYIGILISIVVGYLSPLLGIGGGIIHVPALVNWLNFPVYIATATSHFILAIMSSVSVITHIVKGNYNDPFVLKMVFSMGAGAIVGAQFGAVLSHRIKGSSIIRALAICLGLVGLRILFGM